MITNQSPFWLRLSGTWVHLDGVEPGVDVASNRATSSFTSTDGVRWVQQAPRGPRDWSLSYKYATPDAMAALAVAADVADDVWLLDTTLSQANMLPPDVCYGPSGGTVLDCDGTPLTALDLSSGWSQTVPVRAGVTYYATTWTNQAGVIGSVVCPGGSASLTSVGGLASASFTPTTDGDATMTLTATTAYAVAGAMLSETVEPSTFLPGARMPCRVSVGDAGRTVNMAWQSSYAWSDYTITVQEVG